MEGGLKNAFLKIIISLKRSWKTENNEILNDTQILVLNVNKLKDIVPQRKICERITKKTHERKQLEISIQEGD